MYSYLGTQFITVNMNKTLKLQGTKFFNSRWTFRQCILVVKICMFQVQRVDYLIRQDTF